ncbi:hypothetical protein KFL_000750330 [Klebsormidium nitens]|uniref:Uncharacterized protein n=1 Tax=Klebsormidium nitens TaxID=105231 RepID=A0A0U9HJ42_KLENI|nr:hypothetical protein KFL_000750330 [Klebsormidium nitens]|eukprot:GAQ81265.1 hypothetical protein KFL_000750330 [Klebsormidium nitens]
MFRLSFSYQRAERSRRRHHRGNKAAAAASLALRRWHRRGAGQNGTLEVDTWRTGATKLGAWRRAAELPPRSKSLLPASLYHSGDHGLARRGNWSPEAVLGRACFLRRDRSERPTPIADVSSYVTPRVRAAAEALKQGRGCDTCPFQRLCRQLIRSIWTACWLRTEAGGGDRQCSRSGATCTPAPPMNSRRKGTGDNGIWLCQERKRKG